jgi:hypothetical protein
MPVRRALAGLADSTIRNDTNHLELVRGWFGRPLWEMQPTNADAYFRKVLREAKPSTRTGRAAALTVYFQFLELRHKAELHNVTGRVVEVPLDEMNRPRASVDPQLRVPPTEAEIEQLFARVARGAGHLPQVRPGRRGAADQRGPDARHRRRSVGAGPVRQAQVRHGKGSRRKGPSRAWCR